MIQNFYWVVYFQFINNFVNIFWPEFPTDLRNALEEINGKNLDKAKMDAFEMMELVAKAIFYAGIYNLLIPNFLTLYNSGNIEATFYRDLGATSTFIDELLNQEGLLFKL